MLESVNIYYIFLASLLFSPIFASILGIVRPLPTYPSDIRRRLSFPSPIYTYSRRAWTDKGKFFRDLQWPSFDRLEEKSRWTTTTMGHRSTRLVSPVSRMVAVLVLVLRAVNVGVVTGKRGRRRKGKRKREGGPGCVYTRTGIPASGHRERERDNRVWM